MDRRKFLTLCVAASGFTAGCTRGGGSPQSPTTPTQNGPNQPSPREDHTPVEPYVDRTCPDRPGNVTEENVYNYVTQFEVAYKYRQLKHGRENAESISYKSIPEREYANVTAVENGFRVQFHVSIGYAAQYDETDSVVHVDKSYEVKYFVNDTSVYRLQQDQSSEAALNPHEEGDLVECSE